MTDDIQPDAQPRNRRNNDFRDSWHLDQKITVALILALLTNAGAGIWWASATDSRLNSLEKSVTMAQMADIPKRVTVLETEIPYIQRDLTAANAKLDKVLENQQERGRK